MESRFTDTTVTRCPWEQLPPDCADLAADDAAPNTDTAVMLFVGVPELHRVTDMDAGTSESKWHCGAILRRARVRGRWLLIESKTVQQAHDSIESVTLEFSSAVVATIADALETVAGVDDE